MGRLAFMNLMVALCAFSHYHPDINHLIWFESLKGKKKLAIRMKEIFYIARAVVLFDAVLFGFIALDVWIFHTVLH